jgi:hypothetical protein
MGGAASGSAWRKILPKQLRNGWFWNGNVTDEFGHRGYRQKPDWEYTETISDVRLNESKTLKNCD